MDLSVNSLGFNSYEAVWGWTREEGTGNLCLGTKPWYRGCPRPRSGERVGNFLAPLASQKDEVKRRCRTVLQSRAERILRNLHPDPPTSKLHIPPWLWFRRCPLCGSQGEGSVEFSTLAGVVYGERASRVLRCQALPGKTDLRTRRTHGPHHPGRRRTLRVAAVHRIRADRPRGTYCSVFRREWGIWPAPEMILPRERCAWARWPGERLYMGLCSRRFTASALALL